MLTADENNFYWDAATNSYKSYAARAVKVVTPSTGTSLPLGSQTASQPEKLRHVVRQALDNALFPLVRGGTDVTVYNAMLNDLVLVVQHGSIEAARLR